MQLFNFFDYGLILFLLFFGIFGFIKGFTQKILSIFSWGGAIGLSFYLYPFAKPFIGRYIENKLIVTLLTCILLFIFFLVIFKIITATITNNIQKSSIGFLDRVLGFIIGTLTGFLIVSLVAIIMHVLLPLRSYPTMMQKSALWPFAEQSGKYIQNIKPLIKGYNASKGDLKSGLNSIEFSKIKATKNLGDETAYRKKDRGMLDSLVQAND
tara:strand:+ start:28782 stop:29414 length:633 start_codon:yes stop_codon:yes gene_type:complete